MSCLRSAALQVLLVAEAQPKLQAMQELLAAWDQGQLPILPELQLAAPPGIPGQPARPELVAPKHVPRRSMHTAEGRAGTVHALAHIEFNAINLALDALWRFSGMPPDYYRDWLQVAREEAYHFSLLQQHLQQLGHAYGDFPAHNSLWEMAERTSCDVLERMALVPRLLEARGLDATPALRAKLAQAGDLAVAAILDIILRDEIGHVAIGNRWYAWCCARQGLDPLAHWTILANRHRAPQLRPPFNLAARSSAGFSQEELDALQALAQTQAETRSRA